MNKILTHCLPILLVASCMSSQDVVHQGIFQQRKYVDRGWFIDLPSARNQEAPGKEAAKKAGVIAEGAMDLPADRIAALLTEADALMAGMPEEQEAVAHADGSAALTGQIALTSDLPALRSPLIAMPALDVLRSNGSQTPDPDAVPQDEVDGINIFALLGFIFAFLVPIAGLVLSIIGLNQTSPGDGHGHGLALAGLIISIVVLAIAIGVLI